MIDKLKSIFVIPELRQRILFTIGVLVVVRVGAHIPIPGVNGETLAEAFIDMKTGLFGLFNVYSLPLNCGYNPVISLDLLEAT